MADTTQTRRIGSLEVSVVGLGCNNFGMRIDEPPAAAVVHAALDAGVNYFDTANSYSAGTSEEYLGRAVAGRRSEAVLATKFGHRSVLADGETGGDPAVVARSADESLARLGVETIDHYMIHQPDDVVPIADTLGALQQLIDAGKVREIGCCNFSAHQLTEAADAAEANGLTPFATVQNHYSVLQRAPETDGVLDVCARRNIGLVPYFPLESGLLTGKYRRDSALPEGSRLDAWKDLPHGSLFLTDERWAGTEALMTVAEQHQRSILELAMSWLAAQPQVVSIIAGATKPEQVQANASATSWALNADELGAIERALAG